MRIRQESQKENAAASAAAFDSLLLAEGLAVGALVLSGVCLMGTHQNTVQRTVVGIAAVVCALLDSTLDRLVSMAVHVIFLLFLVMLLLCHSRRKICVQFY